MILLVPEFQQRVNHHQFAGTLVVSKRANGFSPVLHSCRPLRDLEWKIIVRRPRLIPRRSENLVSGEKPSREEDGRSPL